MRFPIALQLYSVRDEMANDFEGTLYKIKELGYDGVEFAGLYDKSPEEVKELCNKIGLIPISAHVPFIDMINNPEILNCYAEIGCKYVVIPYLTEEYRPGNEKFQEIIEGAKFLGQKSNELGLKLCYHNHDFEFVKIDNQYAIDILYNEVDENILQAEFDTCWVSVGGESPINYLNKYSNRVDLLHLKDYVGSKTENMYKLIGIDDNKKTNSNTEFEFRPVGKGVLNFPDILIAAKSAGTKWIIVEQDNPSLNLTPLECAKSSIDYLKTL